MHKKSKKNYQMKKKERQTSDHCFIRSRKLSQPTGKLNCPLAFTVKNCYSPRIQDPGKTHNEREQKWLLGLRRK